MSESAEPRKRAKTRLTVVTNSELQAFRDCPQKWAFAYDQKLRPKVAPRALSFGSAIHEGLAAGYRTLLRAFPSGNDLRADVAKAAHEAVSESSARWFKEVVENARQDEDLELVASDMEKTVALGEWMVRHYFGANEHDVKNLVPMAVELPYSLVLEDVRGRRLPHLRVEGVLDLVAYDRAAQDIVLADHKTTRGDVQAIDRRVEMDPQMAGYLWALRKLLLETPEVFALHALPSELRSAILARQTVPTGRIVYNVLRKKAPSVPRVNKDGTVSIAAIDTQAALYETALVEQEARGIPRSGRQQEILQELRDRGDSFMSRREFFRSAEEVERWRREVVVEASRLREVQNDPARVTRNAGHCSMPWSMPCTYRGLCLDPDSVEMRAQFRVATTAHEEVAEAQTDTSFGF